MGGGLGPLDLYFTNFGRVVNIDLSHESTWFPTNKKGLLVGAVGPKYKSKNLNRINGNFVSVAQTLKEEFDFIYDSCSMIHFQRSVRQEKINLNYKEMDESIIMFARTISNLMTNKSLFVSATDMAHPYSIEFKEIISQDRILNSFKNENFSVSIILGEHSYVLKRKWRRKTIPKTNRATDLLQKSDLQEYLSTWWPQGSVVRARTLVGVFSFAKISTKTPRVRISKKLIIKSRFYGILYKLLNPIHLKLKNRFMFP